MSHPIRVGITHGDVNGVGYEVILKALAPEGMTELCTPVIFGHQSIMEKCAKMLSIEDLKLNIIRNNGEIKEGSINLVELEGKVPEIVAGEPTKESGASAVNSLNKAIDALKKGLIDVLVTAPISKEAVQSDSFRFPGHTEFLESMIGNGAKATMILFDDRVRVALVTIHLPLAEIAPSITKEKVSETIQAFDKILKKDFACDRPAIAILSLNPHSGDGGLLGKEEQEIISPVISELREKGVMAFGPFASDGFFGHGDYKNFDGIVAMYHDQGLAPFKTLAGDRGVNFTGGLPYVRTSPDHGTAFGIAWKGEADETSMREAIYSAIDIFKRRKVYEIASANPLKKHVQEKPDRGERQNLTEKTNKKEEE